MTATESPSFTATGATRPITPTTRRYPGFATASFVLGIVSIVLGWSFFAPVIGLVLGAIALRNNTSERKLALWGVWLNGVLLALAAVAVFFSVALAGAAFLTLPFSPW